MQKYFYAVLWCMTIALVTSCSPTQAQKTEPQLEPNLVSDGSFEEGGTSWSLKTAKVVSTQVHTGKYSLKYTNKNPNDYQLISQAIPVKPGQIIHFSVWIKGENITTDALWKNKGAGLFIQSYNAYNKYINGSFPFTLPGTFDWTQVKGMYVVPEKADRVSIGLYLRKETVGTAWFDDVSVQVEDPALFQAFLQYPNYRGITTVQNVNPWQLLIRNQIPTTWNSATVNSQVRDAKGKVLFADQQQLSSATKEHILRWQPAALTPGDYSWQVEIVSRDGQKHQQEIFPIHVQQEMPRVYIDAEGFTRIDGERFFPFGIFTGKSGAKGSLTTSPEHMQRMSDAGLNTIFSYVYGDRGDAAQFVDTANQHDLKVIYNLMDLYNGWANFPHDDQSATNRAMNLVKRLQSNPALLAWYINDEFGYGEMLAVEERYQKIADVDNHPIYQVQNKLDILPWIYPSADVIGTDPYPARSASSKLGSITKFVNTTAEVAAGAKGVWQVSQIHDHSLHKGEGGPPSLDQMRNMSYQNLIGGAKGLMYWAYHWLYLTRGANNQRVFNEAEYERRWPEVRKMTQEIKAILPIILHDQKVLLQRKSPSNVVYQTWEANSKLYLMVANPDPQETTLTVQLPQGWQLRKSAPGVTPNLIGQDLQLKFAPIASGVLVLERK